MAKAAKEVRELAADVIATKVKENEAKLFDLKLNNSLGKLENTAQVRFVRRDIARMKTILGEKTAKATK
jgi:large subunit ribosomal protein L29